MPQPYDRRSFAKEIMLTLRIMQILLLGFSLGMLPLAFANPVQQGPVFFDNRSLRTVYLLPEVGGDPVAVLPGERIEQPMDAWADPELSRRNPQQSVFKVVDNVSVRYEGDGRVETSGGSAFERAGQILKGGWKDAAWAEANPYFGDFLNQVRNRD